MADNVDFSSSSDDDEDNQDSGVQTVAQTSSYVLSRIQQM